jgi:hypothetical protein
MIFHFIFDTDKMPRNLRLPAKMLSYQGLRPNGGPDHNLNTRSLVLKFDAVVASAARSNSA